MLPDNIWLGAILIGLLRIGDVSLFTLRTVMIMQGRRVLATAIGFIESLIFILAISQVLAGVTSWVHMVGYAAGFASGTYIGLLLEQLFAIGHVQLRVISKSLGQEIAQKLWDEGFGATVVEGHGRLGPRPLVFCVIKRKNAKSVLRLIDSVDPDAFITFSDNRAVAHGFIPGQRR